MSSFIDDGFPFIIPLSNRGTLDKVKVSRPSSSASKRTALESDILAANAALNTFSNGYVCIHARYLTKSLNRDTSRLEISKRVARRAREIWFRNEASPTTVRNNLRRLSSIYLGIWHRCTLRSIYDIPIDDVISLFFPFSALPPFSSVAASIYRQTKRQEASWGKSIARTASRWRRGESLLGVRGIEIVRAVDRKIGDRAPQRALLSNRIIYTASRVASRLRREKCRAEEGERSIGKSGWYLRVRLPRAWPAEDQLSKNLFAQPRVIDRKINLDSLSRDW